MESFKRSEEIQHIIERIPNKFGYWVTAIVLFVVVSTILLSTIISYNDTVLGSIKVRANNIPLKLVANSSGKIFLNKESKSKVKAGEYIAYIKNSATISDVQKLSKILSKVDINDNIDLILKKNLLVSTNFSLGELNAKYFQFLNSLNLLVSYQTDGYYESSKLSLLKVISEYENMIMFLRRKERYSIDQKELNKKYLFKDFVLLSKAVISELDLDKSVNNYIGSLSSNAAANYEVSQNIQQLENSKIKLRQLEIENHNRDVQLKLELASAVSDLTDNIKAWEEKYVFKAPFDGRVQFLKFFDNDQFIQAGELAFSVVSNGNSISGQAILPNLGAGKIREGNEVLIKLNDYPYLEYGTLKGKVQSISISTFSTNKSEEGEAENYLVNISLPQVLNTNYGMKLVIESEMVGSVEIIVNKES